MKTQVCRLKQPVTITGPDFFGRKAELVIEPLLDVDDIRWRFRGKEWYFSPTIVSPKYLLSSKKRLTLYGPLGHEIEIPEHFLALRYMGLVGVEFWGSKWLPYLTAAEMLEKIKPHLIWSEEDIPRRTVENVVTEEYSALRNGERAFLKIEPTQRDLCVEITVSYKGLGKMTKEFFLTDKNQLEKILGARALGWHPALRPISKVVSLFGWPHDKRVLWPQEYSPKYVLEEAINHRLIDLLGALATLCGDGLFCGKVTSVCAGHAVDVKAVKAAYPNLKKVG